MTVTTIPTAGIADSAVTIAKASGFGKIGQVLSATKTDTFSSSPNGGTFTDVTGLSVSITPTSTSSKIYVFCNLTVASVQSSDNSTSVAIRLVRDSTAIFVGTENSGSQTNPSSYVAVNHSDTRNNLTILASGLDSPSSSSSVTYKVQITNGFNASGRTVYVNRNDEGGNSYSAMRSASTITLMEVLA